MPALHWMGEAGLLVEFAPRLSMTANTAALAFRSAVDAAGWVGVSETATSLKSVFLRFDPDLLSHAALEDRVRALAADRDWAGADLPPGRRLWRIPAAFGGDAGPQLDEVAEGAGVTPDAAVAEIASAPIRVLTMGFSPGMPYLGELPERFGIARQSGLTPCVPRGAVCLAIRQLVLFTVATQTGWRQIALSAFRGFDAHRDDPIALRPGDEVLFEPDTPATIARLEEAGGLGGTAEVIA